MKLTAQMWDEVAAITARYNTLHGIAYSNYPDSWPQVPLFHHQELNNYKIQLEIFFSEKTDIKEQSRLGLQGSLFNAKM